MPCAHELVRERSLGARGRGSGLAQAPGCLVGLQGGPAARVEELIASGGAELFDPGLGRTSKTWAAVPVSAGDCWPELALAARAFAET